jgi:hypothetical protein
MSTVSLNDFILKVEAYIQSTSLSRCYYLSLSTLLNLNELGNWKSSLIQSTPTLPPSMVVDSLKNSTLVVRRTLSDLHPSLADVLKAQPKPQSADLGFKVVKAKGKKKN